MTLSSAAVLTLAIACAYANALFLPNPKEILKKRDARSVGIVLSVFVTNVLLWYLTKLDPLIALLVWLPALAGIVAARLLRNKRDRGN